MKITTSYTLKVYKIVTTTYIMKVFRSFEEARKFVRKLGLKSQREWNQYVKSGKKPDDIPSFPPQTCREEWKSWGDWLGTGTVATQNRIFRDFKSVREFVRELNLKNASEWNQYVKSGKLPNNIPTAPNRVYNNKGWINWGNFLGTGKISTLNREYISFQNAKDHVRKLKLTSQKEWREYCTSGNRPANIPSAPERCYKDSWKNFADWLGIDTKTKKNKSKKKLKK